LTRDRRDQHCIASQAVRSSCRYPEGCQKGPPTAGFCNWPPVSRLPFRLFGRPNRRKSPAVFENIPVFRRLRPETWFERHCQVRVAVMPGIHLSISGAPDRMSALPPKADIGCAHWDVRYGPKADSCTAASSLLIRSPRRHERANWRASGHRAPSRFQVHHRSRLDVGDHFELTNGFLAEQQRDAGSDRHHHGDRPEEYRGRPGVGFQQVWHQHAGKNSPDPFPEIELMPGKPWPVLMKVKSCWASGRSVPSILVNRTAPIALPARSF